MSNLIGEVSDSTFAKKKKGISLRINKRGYMVYKMKPYIVQKY